MTEGEPPRRRAWRNMFVGHLAVALGAKKAEPHVPLWGLVAASYGIDLLWPLLLLAGLETVRVDPGEERVKVS